MFFERHESRYPYSEDGRIPGNPDGLIDPFSALAFIAGHTQAHSSRHRNLSRSAAQSDLYGASGGRRGLSVGGAFRLRRGGRLAEGGVCLPWSAMGAQGRSHRRLHRGDEGAVDNRRGHSPRRSSCSSKRVCNIQSPCSNRIHPFSSAVRAMRPSRAWPSSARAGTATTSARKKRRHSCESWMTSLREPGARVATFQSSSESRAGPLIRTRWPSSRRLGVEQAILPLGGRTMDDVQRRAEGFAALAA